MKNHGPPSSALTSQAKGQNVIPWSDDEFFGLAVGASHMKVQLASCGGRNTQGTIFSRSETLKMQAVHCFFFW